jgi:Fe-S cluster biogenesis protein NfuA
MQSLEKILDEKVRPALRAHNGNVELLEVTPEGIVKVKLIGACSTCPGAQQTISEIVETALKKACPEIKGVVPVFQVSDELLDEAIKILRKNKNIG